LHARLNAAVAAAAAMTSVLRVVTEQSAEPEIRQVAEQALQSPTVISVLDLTGDANKQN
jgi:hypothetical protein